MGKNHRHQKKLKSEKSKVKLKAKKLPKGTNVTDTSFKVKKIVIREQLKPANEEDLLSKRKLNIKELITRLQHHNTVVRSSAINDLKELITAYQNVIIAPNLSRLLEGAAPLVLDREKNVRKESLKLMSLILSPVSINQMLPFFDILSSYLRCSMTHIDNAIREDSLFFLDTLLMYLPSLVAKSAHKILPSFLNLISKLRNESKPERTLTVNLGSKFTMIKWRTKVLDRLYNLIKAIVNFKKQKNVKTIEKVVSDGGNAFENHPIKQTITYEKGPIVCAFNKKKCTTVPLYNNTFLDYCNLSIFDNTVKSDKVSSEDSSEEETLDEFLNVLMPLLFDTWLEVSPSNNRGLIENDSVISQEASTLLKSTLDLIKLLWELIEICEKQYITKRLSNMFVKKYSKDFSNFFVKKFPFSLLQSSINKKRDSTGFFVSDNSADEASSIDHNLMICYLFCLFNPNLISEFQQECASDILNYVNELLVSWKKNLEVETVLYITLNIILIERSKTWKVHSSLMYSILTNFIGCYQRKKFTHDHQMDFLKLLCDILYVDSFNHHKKYNNWIGSLPESLCSNNVTSDIVDVLLNLCRRKNQILMNSLLPRLPEIYMNFISKVTESKEISEEQFIKLIHMLYWLPKIPREDLSKIKYIFKTNRHTLSNNVHSHFKDIFLSLKSVEIIE